MASAWHNGWLTSWHASAPRTTAGAVKRTVLLLLALMGCDPATSPADTGVDAPVAVDALLDAARSDARPADAPSLDAPSNDAPDATEVPDAATQDAGADDASADDAPSECDIASVTNAATGILFTSESDYPLIVERFDGEGDDAPTAEDVVRLAELPDGSDTEAQTVEWFFEHLVEFPETTGDRVASLRTLVEASWSSAIVVRVPDADRPAQIHVYLVAQDGCGNLVWLESTAVET